MNSGLIRAAHGEDLSTLTGLRRRSIESIPAGAYNAGQLARWAISDVDSLLADQCRNGWLLVAAEDTHIAGFTGLDLDHAELSLMFVDPSLAGHGIGRQMMTAAEQLACRFGVRRLIIEASLNAVDFYHHCGYRDCPDQDGFRCQRANLPGRLLEKDLSDQLSPKQQRIIELMSALQIPENYPVQHRLPMLDEAGELAPIGEDVFQRSQQMLPAAAAAWQAMQTAALQDQVGLLPVSAFRSIDYQVDLLKRKCAAGHCMEDILQVSAAPGFSEHHTGRAIDVTAFGSNPLEEEFETTDAFQWLTARGANFGFYLTYPRDNIHGISYEPWHWCFRG